MNTTEQPTPETDAYKGTHETHRIGGKTIYDHAENLERQRDEVQHTLNQERAWRQEAERRPQAELDHLRLDVAFLTGRLKERQMAALQRENRLLEQVRDLRKVAEEALSLLKDLSDCFESPGYRWEWQESGRRIRAHVESWRMRLNAVPTQTGTTEGGAA